MDIYRLTIIKNSPSAGEPRPQPGGFPLRHIKGRLAAHLLAIVSEFLLMDLISEQCLQFYIKLSMLKHPKNPGNSYLVHNQPGVTRDQVGAFEESAPHRFSIANGHTCVVAAMVSGGGDAGLHATHPVM
jgi:hypothetical protein